MIEQAYIFGENDTLTGITTEDDSASVNNNDIAVIILNSGLLHKPGPFRLSTTLSREIAKLGMVTFRFDLSGIGDSKKHKDVRVREDQILGDIQEAMNFIGRKKGINKFIILGICTGADNTHKIAVIDDRVVGAVFMDGYAYPTVKYHMKEWQPRLLRPLKLASHTVRLIRRFFSSQKEKYDDSRKENYFWELPPKQKTEAELREFVDRGMNMLFIFTGSWVTFLYPQQMNDSFSSIDFKGRLQVDYLKNASHLYVASKSRERVIQVILQWLNDKYITKD